MKVIGYVWEDLYQGLHGIDELAIFEVSDDIKLAKEEINDWGAEAAEDLIYSFGLEEEYEEDEMDFGGGWFAYKIKDAYYHLSIKKLEEICNEIGTADFIEDYCEKEPLV